MRKICEGLYVGSQSDCRRGSGRLSVVHACKSPCHQEAVGYTGNLSREHEYYLSLERGNDLYMNIIDPKIPLFMPESFQTFRLFAQTAWTRGNDILIHCNQSMSRAPSLALVFLAKELKTIDNDSYAAAREAYENLDPEYSPGQGIQTFLRDKWDVI